MKSTLLAVSNKIKELFKQGLSPQKIAESIIVAILLTIIPVPGVSTLLISVVSLKRKLNLPIMIAISYLFWPLQILLILPFIRLGASIFEVPTSKHTLEEIMYLAQNNFFKMLGQLSFELLCGLGSWLLLVLPASIVIYWLTRLLILILSNKK